MATDCCTLVIFGGTGDLAHRKLVPAIYNMHINGLLPPAFKMTGIGRKPKKDSQYREELAASAEKYSSLSWEAKRWAELENKFYYLAGDLHDDETYTALESEIEKSNVLYYLAVTPQFFPVIASHLGGHGMATGSNGWRRIMIEKPFGFDFNSAFELNSSLTSVFKEDHIYRIDHYLGKEMLRNILTIRFANTVFEPLWNNRFIDNVQISVLENEGIGDRGRYYDRAGAMRDMVQSHLMQMLAVTAMEPPAHNRVDAVKEAKLELLGAVQLWPDGKTADRVTLGQYSGFLQEKDIAPDSVTETFAAVKLAVNNPRWQGVPFYLRTGKMLTDKLAKIVIQFKSPSHFFAGEPLDDLSKDVGGRYNLLTLKIQPSEGVIFEFNIKKPGTINEIVPATMDFCQPCAFRMNTPEAYEKLLEDAMNGDPARFTTWNEIEKAWKLTDKIYLDHSDSGRSMHLYPRGSSGPEEAHRMLGEDGRKWWES